MFVPEKSSKNKGLNLYFLLFGWSSATYWVRTPTFWDGKNYVSGLAHGWLPTAYAQSYPDVLPGFCRSDESGVGERSLLVRFMSSRAAWSESRRSERLPTLTFWVGGHALGNEACIQAGVCA